MVEKKQKRIIKARFNILDTGRKYTGQQRNYIVDNAKKVLNSPIVKERINNGELLGYWGHFLREKSGEIAPNEKVTISIGGGKSIVIDAIPSHRTLSVSIDNEGNVDHETEVFYNSEGDKVWAMHENKVGGFSWAAKGGLHGANTLLEDFRGFDYVKTPLFLANKGYVLDSSSCEASTIFDSLSSAGVDDCEGMACAWSSPSDSGQLNELIFDYEQKNIDLQIKNKKINSELKSLREEYSQSKSKNEREKKSRIKAVEEFAKKSRINIPQKVLDTISDTKNNDFNNLYNFICDVARIDTRSLPIGNKEKDYIKHHVERSGCDDAIPDMGTFDKA